MLWEQVAGKTLTATEGQPIGVLYPGRANGNNGPDFRDAVILDGSLLLKGDIEIHTRSGDWYRHGHHRDAHYNGTVLHVAMWHDCHSATLLENSTSVPLLCLAQALRHQAYLMPYRLPCFQISNRRDRDSVRELLNAAGEARFKAKAMRFQNELLLFNHAGQALFRGMMRALGYSRNTRPFEELADKVPLTYIESLYGLLEMQALLLGTAGLLPSQRRLSGFSGEEEARMLERAWHSLAGKGETMSEDDWRFSHIYPSNTPVRRIVAQSYLLERYCRETCREPFGGMLAAGLLELVRGAPVPGRMHSLEQGLTVTGDGYWRHHFDFGVESRTQTPALLGKSKAGEIAINVLLPFAFARGKMDGDRHLAERALDIYRSYHRLSDNELTRHMARQLCLHSPSGITACQQQGLIHIFRNYCREGRCAECPVPEGSEV